MKNNKTIYIIIIVAIATILGGFGYVKNMQKIEAKYLDTIDRNILALDSTFSRFDSEYYDTERQQAVEDFYDAVDSIQVLTDKQVPKKYSANHKMLKIKLAEARELAWQYDNDLLLESFEDAFDTYYKLNMKIKEVKRLSSYILNKEFK